MANAVRLAQGFAAEGFSRGAPGSGWVFGSSPDPVHDPLRLIGQSGMGPQPRVAWRNGEGGGDPKAASEGIAADHFASGYGRDLLPDPRDGLAVGRERYGRRQTIRPEPRERPRRNAVFHEPD